MICQLLAGFREWRNGIGPPILVEELIAFDQGEIVLQVAADARRPCVIAETPQRHAAAWLQILNRIRRLAIRRSGIGIAILHISLSTLVGCQVDHKSDLSREAVAAGESVDEVVWTSDGNNHERIELSADGVGGINKETPATSEGLSAALPDFTIEAKTGSSEGFAYTYFIASRPGIAELKIIPKVDGSGVNSVVAIGNGVHNTLGHPIGSLFKTVYPSSHATDCQPGLEELSGTVLCSAPSANNIVYQFSDSWGGPDGEMPPRAVLDPWALTQIGWSPPSDE